VISAEDEKIANLFYSVYSIIGIFGDLTADINYYTGEEKMAEMGKG
jgi:hypothetical protein